MLCSSFLNKLIPYFLSMLIDLMSLGVSLVFLNELLQSNNSCFIEVEFLLDFFPSCQLSLHLVKCWLVHYGWVNHLRWLSFLKLEVIGTTTLSGNSHLTFVLCNWDIFLLNVWPSSNLRMRSWIFISKIFLFSSLNVHLSF